MPKVDQIEPGAGRWTGRQRLALAALCLYWPGIFVISHLPKEDIPPGWIVSGLALHVVAYSLLTLLIVVGAGLFPEVSFRSRKTWLVLGVIALYAAADEALQTRISGRHGSAVDWGVDVAVCLGCLLFLQWWSRRPARRLGP